MRTVPRACADCLRRLARDTIRWRYCDTSIVRETDRSNHRALHGISMGRTGFVYHPAFLEHDMGPGHPESPERLRAIVKRLQSTGTLDRLQKIEPVSAPDEWITQIHTPDLCSDAQSPCSGQRTSVARPRHVIVSRISGCGILSRRRRIGRRRRDHVAPGGSCVLCRTAARASRGTRSRDGILPVQ